MTRRPLLLLVWVLLAAAACASQGGRPPYRDPELAPAGRLPQTVRPLAYRVALRIDPRETSFGGSVEIDLQLDEARSTIWLHGNGLVVDTVTAEGEDGATAEGRYRQVLDSGVARLDLDRRLGPGRVTLSLRYHAPFDRNLAGLFKVEERGESYALAKSESIQARRFLPGFDEPGLKATFDLRLTIPEGYVAIGNGPEIDRRPVGEGFEGVTFARTPPMPTYLLSLAVGPFDVVERPALAANELRNRSVPLRGIARKGRAKDLGFMLDSAFASFEAGRLAASDLWEFIEASARAEATEVVRLPLRRLAGARRHLAEGEEDEQLPRWADLYDPALVARSAAGDRQSRLLASQLSSFLAQVARQEEARSSLTEKAYALTGFGREPDPSALDSDLYTAALTVAVQESGPEFFDHLLRFRATFDDPRFEAASATALGASGDPESLAKVEDLILDGDLGPREVAGLLFEVLAVSPLREELWLWVAEHFEEIATRVPTQWRRRLPKMAESFCSEKVRDELQKLFAQHGASTPGYERALAQTLERIELCIAQREAWRSLLLGTEKGDPDTFAKPGRLDFARRPNLHVAFGADIHL